MFFTSIYNFLIVHTRSDFCVPPASTWTDLQKLPSKGVHRLDSMAGALSYVYVLVKPIQQTRTFGPQERKASPAWPTIKTWCPHCDARMELSMLLLSTCLVQPSRVHSVDGVEGIASVRSYLVDDLNPRGCCMGTVELVHKTGATPSRDQGRLCLDRHSGCDVRRGGRAVLRNFPG